MEVGPSDTSAFQKTCFNGHKKRKQDYASGWRLPYGEEVGFSLFGCVQIRAQRGRLVGWCLPGRKGEVVHPGVPESQCVYRTRFYRVLSVLSLNEIHRIKATD